MPKNGTSALDREGKHWADKIPHPYGMETTTWRGETPGFMHEIAPVYQVAVGKIEMLSHSGIVIYLRPCRIYIYYIWTLETSGRIR